MTLSSRRSPGAGRIRCSWAAGEPNRTYHDREWGVPLHDDRRHFEFIILDGAQAGLSWVTILKKRDHYRRAFDDFDPRKVARYGPARIARLLRDPGIVRNRLKIESAVSNARAFLKVQEEFGTFDRYIWRFTGGSTRVNRRRRGGPIPARTPESDAMSRDLKARGFRFVGSTICYAYMQAAGMVNDHAIECFRHAPLAAAARLRGDRSRGKDTAAVLD
jgi:DNA-3-methyladenine glycosylase I